jgi:hypothetical protein
MLIHFQKQKSSNPNFYRKEEKIRWIFRMMDKKVPFTSNLLIHGY